MRVWPLASVLVLVVASGCKSTPADESSKRRHDDDSTSSYESSTHETSTRSTSASKAVSYAYSQETNSYSSYGMGNPQYNVGPLLLGAPIAKSYMRKGADAVLGGLGLVVLLGSLDFGPLSTFTGGGGGMLLLSGALFATFAVRVAGPAPTPDDEPAKGKDGPKRKKRPSDDMDRPDMPAPPVPMPE